MSFASNDEDYTNLNSPDGANKKQRKSAQGRRLMRWDVGTDQHVLLAVEYVCAKDGIAIPWDAVARQIEPFLSGEAIKQHLTKVRKARVDEGLKVPPTLDRSVRRKATSTTGSSGAFSAPATKKKGRAKTTKDLDDGLAKRSALLPPPKPSTRKKNASSEVSDARDGGNEGARNNSLKQERSGRAQESGGFRGSKRGRGNSVESFTNESEEESDFETPAKRLRPQESKDYTELPVSDAESMDGEADPFAPRSASGVETSGTLKYEATDPSQESSLSMAAAQSLVGPSNTVPVHFQAAIRAGPANNKTHGVQDAAQIPPLPFTTSSRMANDTITRQQLGGDSKFQKYTPPGLTQEQATGLDYGHVFSPISNSHAQHAEPSVSPLGGGFDTHTSSPFGQISNPLWNGGAFSMLGARMTGPHFSDISYGMHGMQIDGQMGLEHGEGSLQDLSQGSSLSFADPDHFSNYSYATSQLEFPNSHSDGSINTTMDQSPSDAMKDAFKLENGLTMADFVNFDPDDLQDQLSGDTSRYQAIWPTDGW